MHESVRRRLSSESLVSLRTCASSRTRLAVYCVTLCLVSAVVEAAALGSLWEFGLVQVLPEFVSSVVVGALLDSEAWAQCNALGVVWYPVQSAR